MDASTVTNFIACLVAIVIDQKNKKENDRHNTKEYLNPWYAKHPEILRPRVWNMRNPWFKLSKPLFCGTSSWKTMRQNNQHKKNHSHPRQHKVSQIFKLLKRESNLYNKHLTLAWNASFQQIFLPLSTDPYKSESDLSPWRIPGMMLCIITRTG